MFFDRPAVRDLGDGYVATYGEHLDRVARLCSVFRELGVGPSDRVGVLAGASHVYPVRVACCPYSVRQDFE